MTNLRVGVAWLVVLLLAAPLAAKDPDEKLDYRVAALEAAVAALQDENAAQQAEILSLQGDLAAAEARLTTLEGRPIFALEPFVSIDTGTLEGVVGPHILFEGANVHVRDGSGATGSSSGLGNLVVGYNAYVGWPRTGAHNLVLGGRNSFSSYGGLVAGELNTISGPFATVTGGQWNIASAQMSTVSGGNDNEATGYCASVSGGFTSRATSFAASVCGGVGNVASADGSSVTGGWGNVAAGPNSTVSGGQSRAVLGEGDWAAGSLFEDQ